MSTEELRADARVELASQWKQQPCLGQGAELAYLPLRAHTLGVEGHVSELRGGAEGLHALGCPQELLQQLWLQRSERLLRKTVERVRWRRFSCWE